MAVRLTILGSGSRGNCAYLETDEVRLLIDAGFSGKQIRDRLASIGRTPETLHGILLTHEHSDHCRGLKVLSGKMGIPLYANRLTLDAVTSSLKTSFKGKVFQTGYAFDIGDVSVETFSIPHDAQDPVGFVLRTQSCNIAFLTDLGHATGLVLDRVRPAHALVLETNYDTELLQSDTRRPWSIKQRIMSRHGHLSNEAAAKVASALVSDHLRHIYLAHLSKDCNEPKLAAKVVEKALHEKNAHHIQLHPTDQTTPCPTLILDPPISESPDDPDTKCDATPALEEKSSLSAVSRVPEEGHHSETVIPALPDEMAATEQEHASFFQSLKDELPFDEEEEPNR